MPVGPEYERLLTSAECAALWKVDPKTITRWARAGKIGSIRTLGGHRRYRESEVRALLEPVPEAPADPLKAPVMSLWGTSASGPGAAVRNRLQSIGLATAGALVQLSAAELRSVGLSANQVDEVRLVLYRKGLALSGDVLGDVAC